MPQPPQAVIITGGAGFVGRHLVAELQKSWPQAKLVVWDQQVDQLPLGVTGEVIDLTQPEGYRARLARWQPEWLVHLAAVSAIGESLKDPQKTQETNVRATKDLLEAIVSESPATKVLAVSSSDMYGAAFNDYGSKPVPELPLSSAKPLNPYAASKVAMEQVIEESFNEHVIRVRPFPHIGPGQRLGFVTADFASQIAAIETEKQEAVIKVGNLDMQRDFTDVRDVVRAYCLLLERGEMGEVYHVASGKAVTMQSILDQLVALSSAKISVEVDPARVRPSDIPISVGDASKLKTATNWQPKIPLEQSLQDILTWWRNKIS